MKNCLLQVTVPVKRSPTLELLALLSIYQGINQSVVISDQLADQTIQEGAMHTWTNRAAPVFLRIAERKSSTAPIVWLVLTAHV